MKPLLSVATLALLGAMSLPVAAHHSYATFDVQKVTEIKGTVKEFHYQNPHTWIVLMTQDATGKAIEATVEANGPGYLVRAGWNRNSLKVGDEVTLSVNPMRDGTPGGSLVKVTFPDGHSLNTRM